MGRRLGQFLSGKGRSVFVRLLAVAAIFQILLLAGPANAFPCPVPDITIDDEGGEIRPAVQPREEC
jgi:hypothetical protein